MARSRTRTLAALAKGLAAAILMTLAGMALTAALSIRVPISDGALTVVNQVLKAASIVLGTVVAVGRGGERGFVTGMALAATYMILGYAGYVGLGGSAFSAADMLGEILFGAALGSVCGAILANLPARPRRRAA